MQSLPHIIVIEDDPFVGRLVTSVLTDLPAAVIHYPFVEALPALTSLAPALVVLDFSLPGTDGLTFFHQLRAQPHLASVPVLFITVSPWVIEQALPDAIAQHAYILSKPFPLDVLEEFARELIA